MRAPVVDPVDARRSIVASLYTSVLDRTLVEGCL